MVTIEPGKISIGVTMHAPTVLVGPRIRPPVTRIELTTFRPTVSTSTPKAIVTSGLITDDIFMEPGDEWIATLSGPSASDVSVRVQVNIENLES